MLTCRLEAITFWNHVIFRKKCTVGIGRDGVVIACQTNEHTWKHIINSDKHFHRKNIEALVNAINTFDFTEAEKEEEEDTDNETCDEKSDNDNCSDEADGDEINHKANAEDSQIESQPSSNDSTAFETPRKELPVLKRARYDDYAATMS